MDVFHAATDTIAGTTERFLLLMCLLAVSDYGRDLCLASSQSLSERSFSCWCLIYHGFASDIFSICRAFRLTYTQLLNFQVLFVARQRCLPTFLRCSLTEARGSTFKLELVSETFSYIFNVFLHAIILVCY